jgi:hypothetical protein
MRNMDLALHGLCGLSLGLSLCLVAPRSFAADAAAAAPSNAKKKVLVGGFKGPKSKEARASVISALKEDGAYDVSESHAVKPGADDKSFASASNGATAVIVGTVKKSGLTLSVHNGADGALVQDVEIKGDSPAKLNKNIGDSVGLSVADPIAQTKAGAVSADAPPAAAEPDKGDDEDKPEPEQADAHPGGEAAAPEGDKGLTPLELTAGLRAVHRSFSWHDTPAQLFPDKNYPSPQTYSLPLGPAVFIEASLFPGAWVTKGPGAWFGLTGGYELNFATKSVYGTSPNEQTLTTKANQWFGGVKARIPVAAHEFGFVAGTGAQVYNLLGDETDPQVPDVWYKFWLLRAEGRLHFNAASVGFHLGTRLTHNTGGLERDWFPGHVKTQNIEMGVSAGYVLAPNFELVGGLDYVRYAFDFNPTDPNADPTMKVVAGGAVDQYTSGWLGLRISLPSHPSN